MNLPLHIVWTFITVTLRYTNLYLIINANRSYEFGSALRNRRVLATVEPYFVTHAINAHRAPVALSTCDRLKVCKECGQLTRRSEAHHCREWRCSRCKSYVPLDEEHKCYIQPVTEDPMKEISTMIYFDFETTQDTEIGENAHGSIYGHDVKLAVVQKVSDQCKDTWDRTEQNCPTCGEHQMVFRGDTCLSEFCDWLFSEKHKGAVALAHYGKAFDTIFLVKYLLEQGVAPDTINQGMKVMKLEVGGITILDSFSFLPMRLAALPKAFDFQGQKGYFPYLAFKNDNQDYIGPIPPPEAYGLAKMKEKEAKEFLKWHSEQTGEFDMRREALHYCQSDVDLLRQGVLKFRDIFLKETNVDPLLTSATIAGACNYVFRRNYLKPNTIGNVPNRGYRRKERASVEAIQYLTWLGDHEGLDIQHAGNGPEVQIGQFRVDGFCESNNTIYEYHGCIWHGHPTCLPSKRNIRKVPGSGQTLEDAYQRTMWRESELKRQGYTVVSVWACDVERERHRDPTMAEAMDKVEVVLPLDARQGFYGGRTNATRLYHTCAPGEKLRYIDVCSLYPWTNKYCKYPIGHPEIITKDFGDLDSYLGMIKARVLPPGDLLHPVLPRKSSEGKLTFPLCSACSDQKTRVCHHPEMERSWVGTWPSFELQEAVRQGYQVLEIFEIWHYPETSEYDGTDPDTGLFTNYINKFLKLKQQSSGWPSWVTTEEDKDKYIVEYEEKEGIQLDPSQVERNAGLRSFSKLCLNSFWGKFGQRCEIMSRQFFTSPKAFFDVVLDPTNEIGELRFMSDKAMMVSYKPKADFAESLPNTSTVIAAFVTAYARLKLYSYIKELGQSVCYYDTDSVIHVETNGEPQVATGDYLGDMTDELKDYGPGSYITEFISGGPKNYAYKVHSTKDGQEHICTKVKGFTLNAPTAKIITFEAMKRLVLDFTQGGDENEQIEVKSSEIRRLPDYRVATLTLSKRYQVVYDKRMLMPDYSTRPWGWRGTY